MYSAASGMEAQQQRLDALSNDLANASTSGYKRSRLAFRDLLYTPSGRGAARGVASGAGAAATSVGRVQAEGSMQSTGRLLDVAVTGPGFIAVSDARGRLALTRDGNLQRRKDGELVTTTGAPTGVRIPRAVADGDIGFKPDGTVTAGTRTVGRLRLVTVAAPDQLRPAGDNLFALTAGSGRAVAAGPATQVQQGMLESSNVDVGNTMVDLIDAQRTFELASKAINTQDQMLEIANGVKR
jgi:flagellar basal-body rod protein FlgG